MFSSLRRFLARRAIRKRLEHHYAQAEGSDFQRLCIAAAMTESEEDMVQRHGLQLSPGDQLIFMIAYECFVMWCLKQGLQKVLKPDQTDSVVAKIRRHFSKHAWYQDEAIEAIWHTTEVSMPMAMETTDSGCPPYPLAGITVAIQTAGYTIELAKLTDIALGIHVALTLGKLIDLGKSAPRTSGPV
jgi:hypothetical protein